MSRRRVMRVIARMNVGGPALQVTGLAEELDRERFDQRILAGFVGSDEADYLDLRAPHIEVTRVVGLGRSPNVTGDLRAFVSLVREMRQFRPHIVHTHTAKAGVLGRMAARAARVPLTVHTFHGHLLHGYFSPRTTKAVVLTERTFARKTSCLVAVGGQVRDDLLAAGIGRPEQYRVVPPGLALPEAPSRADARSALGLPLDVPVVCFVARLTKVKRPDRFLDAARRVAAVRPDVHFVVAGEGDLLDWMQTAGSNVPNLHFLGWRPDVETVYAASDVVLLTSDNEGMPVSLIEAAMVGRAAVTTRVGSAGEVVLDGTTGFVVDLDATAVADATLALLVDNARRGAMGRAAADRARLHFSRQRLVQDTEAIYEDLLARSGLTGNEA